MTSFCGPPTGSDSDSVSGCFDWDSCSLLLDTVVVGVFSVVSSGDVGAEKKESGREMESGDARPTELAPATAVVVVLAGTSIDDASSSSVEAIEFWTGVLAIRQCPQLSCTIASQIREIESSRDN